MDPRPQGGHFILVVDDFEPGALMLARRLDGRGGLEAIAFTAGADALAHCETRAPAIALLDIRMPGMDGVTLAGRLRTRHPSLPIVFVTGTPADVDLPALHRDFGGMLQLVGKPYAMATIFALVDPVLEGLAAVT